MRHFMHRNHLSLQMNRQLAARFRGGDAIGALHFNDGNTGYHHGNGWYVVYGTTEQLNSALQQVKAKIAAIEADRNREIHDLLLLAVEHKVNQREVVEHVQQVQQTTMARDLVKHSDAYSRMYDKRAKVVVKPKRDPSMSHSFNVQYAGKTAAPQRTSRPPTEGALKALQRKLTRHI